MRKKWLIQDETSSRRFSLLRSKPVATAILVLAAFSLLWQSAVIAGQRSMSIDMAITKVPDSPPPPPTLEQLGRRANSPFGPTREPDGLGNSFSRPKQDTQTQKAGQSADSLTQKHSGRASGSNEMRNFQGDKSGQSDHAKDQETSEAPRHVENAAFANQNEPVGKQDEPSPDIADQLAVKRVEDVIVELLTIPFSVVFVLIVWNVAKREFRAIDKATEKV